MMRIAIFDGILETHVGDSLERTLTARGHSVFNTGKIGHGFEFATGKIELRRLELAVSTVIDFEPDWVFVFRPASLPPHLITRFKRAGIRLAVWFSDDPVLFDLTYGPVLNDYDLVLHCGNARVLEFYETQFGRPTGVNMPFWTDHVAFPRVWGTEAFATDAMFLGNVQDEVRRDRYFDLAKLTSSVALYGNAGNDYYGLSAGYLDSDEEVVAAGARARVAISVPQYFVNHRGLRTWFPGLDKLGFFEYPSRIIQYMAMGLPVLNVIPGRPTFRSFPEMIVADNFVEADEAIQELKDSGALPRLSATTSDRFDRHFSAEARVIMLEDLFENDSWRQADAEERAIWFTRYEAPLPPETGEHATALGVTSARRSMDPNVDGETADALKVGVLGLGWTRPSSPLSTAVRAIKRLGHQVRELNPAHLEGSLLPDQEKITRHLINVPRLRGALTELDVLVVIGIDASPTQMGRSILSDLGIRTIFVDEGLKHGHKRLDRLAGRYDQVASSSLSFVSEAAALGADHVIHLPHLVDSEFRALVAQQSGNRRLASRWRESAAIEESTVPGYAIDVALAPQTWASLEQLNLEELADALSAELAFVSFGGNRANPQVTHLMSYLLAATPWVVMPRFVGETGASVYAPAVLQVRDPREAGNKLRQLENSVSLKERLEAGRRELLDSTISAENRWAKLLGDAVRNTAPRQARHDGLVVTADNATASIKLGDLLTGASVAAILNVTRLGSQTSSCDRATLSVNLKGEPVWRRAVGELSDRLIIGWPTQRLLADITVELKAPTGPGLHPREWCGVELTLQDGVHTAIAAPPGVYVGQ